MTKTEALQSYFESFGYPAYPSGNVPLEDEDGYKVEFPYLTYTKGVTPSFECTVHLYFYTESELIPDNAIEALCNRLRNGGEHFYYDGGAAWVILSNPEWYSSTDETDKNYKHRIANVLIDYLELM